MFNGIRCALATCWFQSATPPLRGAPVGSCHIFVFGYARITERITRPDRAAGSSSLAYGAGRRRF
jgi:hypothetical protein